MPASQPRRLDQMVVFKYQPSASSQSVAQKHRIVPSGTTSRSSIFHPGLAFDVLLENRKWSTAATDDLATGIGSYIGASLVNAY